VHGPTWFETRASKLCGRLKSQRGTLTLPKARALIGEAVSGLKRVERAFVHCFAALGVTRGEKMRAMYTGTQ